MADDTLSPVQDHHVIPQKTFKTNRFLIRLRAAVKGTALEARLGINALSNRIMVPTTDTLAERAGYGPHRGSHRAYSKGVTAQLARLSASPDAAAARAGDIDALKRVVDQIVRLEATLKVAIVTDAVSPARMATESEAAFKAKLNNFFTNFQQWATDHASLIDLTQKQREPESHWMAALLSPEQIKALANNLANAGNHARRSSLATAVSQAVVGGRLSIPSDLAATMAELSKDAGIREQFNQLATVAGIQRPAADILHEVINGLASEDEQSEQQTANSPGLVFGPDNEPVEVPALPGLEAHTPAPQVLTTPVADKVPSAEELPEHGPEPLIETLPAVDPQPGVLTNTAANPVASPAASAMPGQTGGEPIEQAGAEHTSQTTTPAANVSAPDTTTDGGSPAQTVAAPQPITAEPVTLATADLGFRDTGTPGKVGNTPPAAAPISDGLNVVGDNLKDLVGGAAATALIAADLLSGGVLSSGSAPKTSPDARNVPHDYPESRFDLTDKPVAAPNPQPSLPHEPQPGVPVDIGTEDGVPVTPAAPNPVSSMDLSLPKPETPLRDATLPALTLIGAGVSAVIGAAAALPEEAVAGAGLLAKEAAPAIGRAGAAIGGLLGFGSGPATADEASPTATPADPNMETHAAPDGQKGQESYGPPAPSDNGSVSSPDTATGRTADPNMAAPDGPKGQESYGPPAPHDEGDTSAPSESDAPDSGGGGTDQGRDMGADSSVHDSSPSSDSDASHSSTEDQPGKSEDDNVGSPGSSTDEQPGKSEDDNIGSPSSSTDEQPGKSEDDNVGSVADPGDDGTDGDGGIGGGDADDGGYSGDDSDNDGDSGDDGSDDGDGGDYGGSDPVILDIAGKGRDGLLTQRTHSKTFIDIADDGFLHRTAWAASGEGVLAIDIDHDGTIKNAREFAFTLWDGSAKTDLEAIKVVFDTNHNGKLDPGDDRWKDFGLIVDGNFRTLDALGIASIDLVSNGEQTDFVDGSKISGTSQFTRTDATQGLVADASFSYDTDGIEITLTDNGFVASTQSEYTLSQTKTTNDNGSVTVDYRGVSPLGVLLFEVSSTTSADGLSVMTKVDEDGDGKIDWTLSSMTTSDGEGGTVHTDEKRSGDGTLLDRNVRTVSAGGNITTEQDDPKTGKLLSSITVGSNGAKLFETVADAGTGEQTARAFDSATGAVLSVHRSSAAGALTAATLDDPLNANPWSRIEQSFDAGGQLVEQSQYNDDGTCLTTTYDVANQQSWSHRELLFNTGGQLATQSDYVYDGKRIGTTYDAENTQPWSRIEQLFDANGRLLEQSQYNDDGTRLATTYDVAHQQPWSHIEQLFDSSGRLTAQSQYIYDGTRLATTYDAANTQPWSRIEQHFDAAGSLIEQTGYSDKGAVDHWSASVPNSDSGYDPNFDSGGGGDRPVLLDLNGDGHIDLRPFDVAELNGPRFDWNHDGKPVRTAWVGPNDGFLAIDLGKDGKSGPDGIIDQSRELAFSEWVTPEQVAANGGSVSDLDALRLVFDSNHDNVLDANDDRWSEFRVWRDANQNGSVDDGELQTMSQAGIKLINLLHTTDGSQSFADGSAITGTSSYQATDGASHYLVGDAKLSYQSAIPKQNAA